MNAHTHTADRSNRRTSKQARRQRWGRAIMETLEERQLMSMTLELRAANGSSSAMVTSVGQVLTLDVDAVVTVGTAGTDDTLLTTTPSNFGVNDVTGSIISTGIYSNDVAGNLAATVASQFQANSFQAGTQQDLNGDGNIDVGSNDPTQIEGYFFARHGGIDTTGTATNTSNTIVVGTVTYTVTSLHNGGETDINFVPRATGTSYISADWYDGVEYDSNQSTGEYASDRNDTLASGTPFVITDSALNTAPVVNTDNVSTVRSTALTVNALSNVTTSDALVASSVTLVAHPTHGTAVVQTGGSILYTPTTGYVGSDSFTYHVTDAAGRVSNTGPVDITVTVPPPPVAVADTGTTLRGQAVMLNVLANDTDADGTITPSTVAVATAPSSGTAVVQSGGTILYTPTAGFVGTDTFTYTVGDSLGDTSSAGTVTVTVTNPVPPVAVDDSETDLEGHAATLSVLTNDTTESVAIDPTTVVIGTGPTDGTAVAQSDGTVVYTSNPGFTGTDSFTYSVKDVLGDVSNTATVTVDVTPVTPPMAGNVSATDVESQPSTINVLSSDTAVSVPLDPTKVLIATAPTDGTAVPQSDGTIIYTSNAGFIGTDSFTYTVDDQYGDPSNTATVTVTVTAAPPPTASSFTAPITATAGTPIDVLSNVTSVATLVPSSVTVTTAPANGTTSIDATTGDITYTPNADFVGSDTFSYTAADVNGNVSAPASVSLFVGTDLSSAKGGSKSLTFVDANGHTETVSLNLGMADVLFSGTGTSSLTRGKLTVSGTGLAIAGIELSGTTKASSLAIRSVGNKPISISSADTLSSSLGISDTSPLGSIVAPTATLDDAIVTLDGLTSMTIGGATGSTLSIGAGGAPRITLSLGSVSGTTLISTNAIGTLKVSSWTTPAGSTSSLTAPSIISLTSTGAFAPTLNVSGLSTAHITGALDGTWTDTGAAGAITAGSVASTWTGTISGALTSLTIRSGGLASPLTAASIGTLAVTGDLTSTITAASARTIHVVGNISGATLDFTGAAGIGSLVASSLVDSTVTAGVPAGTTLATATSANLGTGTIGSLVLNGRTGTQFSNSSILAATIRTASLGSINTANNSVPEGLALITASNLSGIIGASSFHFGPHQLATEALLQSYIQQQSISLGDFEIELL